MELTFISRGTRHCGHQTVLEAGPATLLTVIEALGPILTNEDPVIRARGIELLTSVVKRVSIPNRTSERPMDLLQRLPLI